MWRFSIINESGSLFAAVADWWINVGIFSTVQYKGSRSRVEMRKTAINVDTKASKYKWEEESGVGVGGWPLMIEGVKSKARKAWNEVSIYCQTGQKDSQKYNQGRRYFFFHVMEEGCDLGKGSIHRLNMEVDLQSLFGLHVTWCAQLYWLAETLQLPPPRIWPHITRALLVRKDRRHLYITPWEQPILIPFL